MPAIDKKDLLKKQSLIRARIAIIGAGVAGLTAAYYLRREYGPSVVIIEREARLGGRVFTESAPYREHGAEYFVGSERKLNSLIKELKLGRDKKANEYAAYRYGGKWHYGSVTKVFKSLAKEGHWLPKPSWLPNMLIGNSKQNSSRKVSSAQLGFLKMVLTSDMCSPCKCWKPEYVQELFDYLEKDRWYRVKHGAGKLIAALATEIQKAGVQIARGIEVRKVKQTGKNVRVTISAPGFKQQQEWVYDSAIVTTPDPEKLVAQVPIKRHSHAYVSVILCYHNAPPQRSDVPKKHRLFQHGLYMDNKWNYLQGHWDRDQKCYVVRILIPNAARLLRQRADLIAQNCDAEIRKILKLPRKAFMKQVKKWPIGLVCGQGSVDDSFHPIGRIVLAGDRFGQWASMETALVSGKKAAKYVERFLPTKAH